jgi:hypothetical protein
MSAFDLCKARERRFLSDLLEDAADDVRDHPLPELYALLRAVELMWGVHYKTPPSVSPQLIYYIAAYARLAHKMPEDRKERQVGHAHTTYHILKGFMESVAATIKDGSSIAHKDDGAYIDLFRIPQWFYNEVAKDQ